MPVKGGSGKRRQFGGWSGRVVFSDTGGFAYRPGELLVLQTSADQAEAILRERADRNHKDSPVRDPEPKGSFARFERVDAPLRAVRDLEIGGVAASPNHVVFSHCLGCCGPHPALLWPNPFSANPFSANPFSANPFSANPFSANPFSANPFSANPFSANPFSANPFSANPFSANPFSANPFSANPFSANPFSANPFSANPFSANPFSANPFSANPFSANPFSANPFSANPFSANPFSANPFSANPFSANPFSANPFSANDFQPNPLSVLAYSGHRPETAEFRATGWRPHSAHPATGPVLAAVSSEALERSEPSIVVIDTGIADGKLRPQALTGVEGYVLAGWVPRERPDEDSDDHIDPVAGHGTFIAGIIERIAPRCQLKVHGLLGGYGDASEADVAEVLESLLTDQEGPPDLLNLSFGGYALAEMARLGEAVRKLQDAGTVVVASAGNDSTCRPAYPAAFPGVVSVGALAPYGPAPFTNYGPWVRACAPGVDVVSTFFTKWESTTGQDEKYANWVRWSGTSFAAPAVVGALAKAIREGVSGEQAVERLIDDPGLFRMPGLGTVVNQEPSWQ